MMKPDEHQRKVRRYRSTRRSKLSLPPYVLVGDKPIMLLTDGAPKMNIDELLDKYMRPTDPDPLRVQNLRAKLLMIVNKQPPTQTLSWWESFQLWSRSMANNCVKTMYACWLRYATPTIGRAVVLVVATFMICILALQKDARASSVDRNGFPFVTMSILDPETLQLLVLIDNSESMSRRRSYHYPPDHKYLYLFEQIDSKSVNPVIIQYYEKGRIIYDLDISDLPLASARWKQKL
jgi:hypothetical protein